MLAPGVGIGSAGLLRYALLFLSLPATAADFSITPRARLQLDSVDVSRDGSGASGDAAVRRLRLGAEGELPGALRYRVDVELSNGAVVTDAWMRRRFGAATVALGHQRTLNGLDQISSSVHGMFLERAAFTEAADNPRRLGGAVSVRVRPALRLDLGAFGRSATPPNDRDTVVAARLIASPEIGGSQLHLALNGQHRSYRGGVRAARFRARPYTQLIGTRFAATSSVPADGDSAIGVEAMRITGPVWIAAEAQRIAVRGPQPFAIWGGYAEAGVFLTGERRAYADGAWSRTAPARPLGSGGFGAVATTVRLDHLDLASGAVDGGRQTGVLASVVWQPVLNARIAAQVARGEVAGGPAPGAFTMLGLRAQLAY